METMFSDTQGNQIILSLEDKSPHRHFSGYPKLSKGPLLRATWNKNTSLLFNQASNATESQNRMQERMHYVSLRSELHSTWSIFKQIGAANHTHHYENTCSGGSKQMGASPSSRRVGDHFQSTSWEQLKSDSRSLIEWAVETGSGMQVQQCLFNL